VTATLGAPALPTNDADPFGHEVLEDPLPLHAALRDAGPVVHLTRYDVYALARYEQVHAALVDWQQFQSAAGVGMSNFRTEKPWRPPSLLLEADPPRHDAPRRVLQKVLSPQSLRRLRDGWLADAEALIDEVLSEGTEFDGTRRLA
jgi:4-methoxybenzoate monooxygenase (O-demethylating)